MSNFKGKVKFFNSAKGFGFIKPEEGGDDLFVHVNNVESGTLSEDQEVTFSRKEDGHKGPEAVKVSLL